MEYIYVVVHSGGTISLWHHKQDMRVHMATAKQYRISASCTAYDISGMIALGWGLSDKVEEIHD